jgi:chromosome segregation ATPase
MTTDAAQAEGDLLPTEIENAVVDSQEPEQGATSEAEASKDDAVEELSDEETVEKKEEEKQKKRNSYQERISQLARQKNEANSKVQELQQQNAYLQSQYQQQPQDVPTQYPRLEDYDYDEGRHQQAVLEYTSQLNQQNVQQVMSQQQAAQIAQLNNTKHQIASATFVERSNDFSVDYPDFQQKVGSPNFHQSDFVAQEIVDMDNGPAVAYYLSNNPAIANAINRKGNMDALKDLTKISTALSINSRSRSANTTNAPTPSKTVSPRGKVSKSPDKMTPEEYRKYRGYSK